jgi:hypothetical protein
LDIVNSFVFDGEKVEGELLFRWGEGRGRVVASMERRSRESCCFDGEKVLVFQASMERLREIGRAGIEEERERLVYCEGEE